MYDYVDGKLDWMAAGLPVEGTESGSHVGDIVRDDVPTCRLDERLDDVRARVEEGDWGLCVVVNDQGIVLGVLEESEINRGGTTSVEEVMRAGPNTYRPHVPIAAMAHRMVDHEVSTALITTSEGRLLGVVRREDALAAHGHHHEDSH